MEDFLSYTFLAIFLLLAFLYNKYSRKVPYNTAEYKVLTYSTALKICTIGAILFSVMFLVIEIVNFASNQYRVLIPICLTIIAILIHFEVHKVTILYNVYEVKVYSPWRKNRFLTWDEFTTVKFSTDTYIITTLEKGVLKIPNMLVGYKDFLEVLAKKN